MGFPTSEVGYTLAMPRREDHEAHKGHVVVLEGKKKLRLGSFHSRIEGSIQGLRRNLLNEKYWCGLFVSIFHNVPKS
jgi:hypothetical protein